jgi:hypothetical protein
MHAGKTKGLRFCNIDTNGGSQADSFLKPADCVSRCVGIAPQKCMDNKRPFRRRLI